MRSILLAAILLIPPALASAKCGTKAYVLSGTVVQADNSPAAWALVGVAWKEDGLIGGPALARADADGRYSIPINFRTYSSGSGKGWYECQGTLEGLVVLAYDDARHAPPMVVVVPEGALRVDAPVLALGYETSTNAPVEIRE